MTRSPRVLNIVLMIVFCNVKLLSHLYLSRNGLSKLWLTFHDELLCDFQLLLVSTPNAASVLCSIVRSLSVDLCRVMHQEKPEQQLFVGNPSWIIHHLDCLSMPRCPLTYVLISRVQCFPLLVPALSSNDPWRQLECMFDSPKAASCEIRNRSIS